MVTFVDAQEAVRDLEGPTFTGGTYLVADWGRQDATHFQVVTGAREDLLNHHPAFMRSDTPVWFVDKATGRLQRCTYLPGNPTAVKLDAMTVVRKLLLDAGESPVPRTSTGHEREHLPATQGRPGRRAVRRDSP